MQNGNPVSDGLVKSGEKPILRTQGAENRFFFRVLCLTGWSLRYTMIRRVRSTRTSSRPSEPSKIDPGAGTVTAGTGLGPPTGPQFHPEFLEMIRSRNKTWPKLLETSPQAGSSHLSVQPAAAEGEFDHPPLGMERVRGV